MLSIPARLPCHLIRLGFFAHSTAGGSQRADGRGGGARGVGAAAGRRQGVARGRDGGLVRTSRRGRRPRLRAGRVHRAPRLGRDHHRRGLVRGEHAVYFWVGLLALAVTGAVLGARALRRRATTYY